MKPSTSLLILTPSSSAVASPVSDTGGTVVGFHRLVHGQSPWTTMTFTVDGNPRLPLSSIARTLMLAAPGVPGVQSKFHTDAPCAVCHVVPLSTETSTP